jgi:uncharacterized sulfatase
MEYVDTMSNLPNVVVLVIDSVRADHTSLNGYRRNTTPNLRRIAERPEGSNFPNCYALSNSSSASMGSLATGLYPFEHGLSPRGNRIDPDTETVADRFREAGYRTVGVSANSFFSPDTGLDEGFDEFLWFRPDPVEFLRTCDPRDLLRWLFDVRRHSAGLTLDRQKHSFAYLLNESIKRKLSSDTGRSRPTFLCAHYIEPHSPYYPPRPYVEQFSENLPVSGRELAERAMSVHENRKRIIADGCELSDADRAALVAMYDSEIAYVDELIGELFDFVEDLEEETIFVVTADHGDSFCECGHLFHNGPLIDATTHVPMVVNGMEDLDGGGLVQHVDVLETILSRIGADTEGLRGVDLDRTTREYVVCQRPHRYDPDRVKRHDPGYTNPHAHTAPVTSIQDHEYKIRTSSDGTEVYRLPDEERPIDGSDQGKRVEELQTALETFLEQYGRVNESESVEFSDEAKKHLRDLGYMD